VGGAALAGIFAFAVRADGDPVKVGGLAVFHGRAEARQDAYGADVHVLA